MNSFDLQKYRASDEEQKRINSLLGLIPGKGMTALDIGARDGYLSKILTEHFDTVTALDLEKPCIAHDAVTCVKGNAKSLEFPDNSFDLVLCAEVLEHIPHEDLHLVCSELTRVSQKGVIVGVLYKQDIRVGRTTCSNCGKKNPPWGHVNSFDESILKALFPALKWNKVAFVGTNINKTNLLSVLLLDLAGNPYGTYGQAETCIFCNNSMLLPGPRNLIQKIATRLATIIISIQSKFIVPQPNWMHVYFSKNDN